MLHADSSPPPFKNPAHALSIVHIYNSMTPLAMVSLVPEPSEGSPSGSTPPGGSAEDRTDAPAPSDQEIQKIQQQVNRQLAIDDFKGAG